MSSNHSVTVPTVFDDTMTSDSTGNETVTEPMTVDNVTDNTTENVTESAMESVTTMPSVDSTTVSQKTAQGVST